MIESVLFSNQKLNVRVAFAPTCNELFQRLTAFISPAFLLCDKTIDDTQLDLHLILRPYADFPASWKAACTTPCAIRHSSASIFNLTLNRGELNDGHQIAWHESDQTGYCWQLGGTQMEMYVNQQSFIHVIEFFRYYLLAVEVAKGSLILHASGVESCTNGTVVAICGIKGAGKTSTMLNLVTSNAFRYFSGDKLLVDIHKDALRVRSWPDYPHIGAGSLRQHPELCQKMGLSLSHPPLSVADNQDKFLFAPELFQSATGKSLLRSATLSTIVLPNVLGNTSTITALNARDKRELGSSHLFENPLNFITATWHGLSLPEQNSATRSLHQHVRDRLYLLRWLNLSGVIPAPQLAARLQQGMQIRLALVASSGCGKSTTAELLKQSFIQHGLSVCIEKLAQPLYRLQKAYFTEMGQAISADGQHQQLMEKIADNLRMLDPRALINHLFARLDHNDADVILTDDLRDKTTDWPALTDHGYVVIRVQCDDATRRARLHARQDIQSQTSSILDEDIKAIEANIVIDNNGDLGSLRESVNALVGQLLRRRDE
ncbi:dephospho-CoA kinase [Erwinia mallotivora]|uniref:dephospho-CoA kinase n=1 Tax=Erwinia mallotivora TaxID=69222 RepID=UPI0035E81B2B